MPKQKQDQQIEIHFLVKEGLRQVDVVRRLHAVHGRDCLRALSIKRWFNRFKTGQDSVDNLPKSGALKKRMPQKIAEIQNVVHRDACSSISSIARQVGLSYGTVQKALHKDLNSSKLSARWVPHLLMDVEKTRRVVQARASLQAMRSRVNPIDAVVAEDESWFYTWDPESREGSRQWIAHVQPCPTKVWIEQSMPKMMLITFIDQRGPIHCEFVPAGLGIGGAVYLEVLEWFRESFRRKHPDLWRSGRWALLHDGAPAHRCRPVLQWLGQKCICLLPHLGYSLDLNPMDYWFFDWVKKAVKGH